MKTRPSIFYRQSGVIPMRRGDAGVEVLLVTTSAGRWTIPKGVVDLGSTARDSAVREAFEEAGVRGTAGTEPIGSYRYHKWGGECVVEVFLLDVDDIVDRWPEHARRDRRWMSVEEAADVVAVGGLRELLLRVKT